MQIRTRLTWWFFLTAALLLLASFIIIFKNFSNHLQEEYYDSLQSKAVMTVIMLERKFDDLKSYNESGTESSSILPNNENILVYDLNFEKVFAFNPETGITLDILRAIKEKGEYRFKLGKYNAIGIKYTTSLGKSLIIIGKGVFMSKELLQLGQIMAITYSVFLFLIGLIGYFFSRQALMPIINTMNEMDAIIPTSLSQRMIIGKNKDEITRLRITFNSLLERIEDSFKVQRSFLSNISHELRNPLASIISSIQVVLLKDRDEANYRACLMSVLDEARELEHASTMLMDLARITSKSNKVLIEPLRLDEIVWQSKAAVRKNNPDYSFKFDSRDFPEDANLLMVDGNESLLKSAFINLFENGCKFSDPHSVQLRVYVANPQTIAVEIKDTATIIPDEEKEQLFKPFYRSKSNAHVKGSGIGLSLVESILKIHNAVLTIENNENKGNIFTVFMKIKQPNSN